MPVVSSAGEDDAHVGDKKTLKGSSEWKLGRQAGWLAVWLAGPTARGSILLETYAVSLQG